MTTTNLSFGVVFPFKNSKDTTNSITFVTTCYMTSYEWQRLDGGFTLSLLTTRHVRSCDKNCEIYYVSTFCSFHSLWRNTRGSLGTNTNSKVNITLNTVTIIRSTPKLFFCLDTLESKSHIKKKTKIYNPLNYDFIT